MWSNWVLFLLILLQIVKCDFYSFYTRLFIVQSDMWNNDNDWMIIFGWTYPLILSFPRSMFWWESFEIVLRSQDPLSLNKVHLKALGSKIESSWNAFNKQDGPLVVFIIIWWLMILPLWAIFPQGAGPKHSPPKTIHFGPILKTCKTKQHNKETRWMIRQYIDQAINHYKNEQINKWNGKLNGKVNE